MAKTSWNPSRTQDLGWHYLSNATCLLIRPRLFCVFRRVKDHRNLLHCSPCLKKTCVRQVVLDKRFPLKTAWRSPPWTP